jgi:hypothetical protein
VNATAARPPQRYRCPCQHAFQVFGQGRHRRIYELDDQPSGPGADIYPARFADRLPRWGRKLRRPPAATREHASRRRRNTSLAWARLRDTDDGRVVIRRSARRLHMLDLVPFRAAIAANVPLVMVSHALYPRLDRGPLASQSRKIVTLLLRTRLGYEGAVVRPMRLRRAQSVAVSRSQQQPSGHCLPIVTCCLLSARPASGLSSGG